MRILAGLGNPGAQYAGHRHNIGFMALDAIHRRHGFSPWSKKFKGEIAEGTLGGEKVLLIKPQTFMNLSGESVGEALRFYKLAPADLTVIYDELDLAPGRARIKVGGGHGGHNGIKSIDAHCGTDYRRLRLGIGHPGSKERVNGHVLGDFAKADRSWLEPLLDALADHADLLIRGEDSQFLNKLALAVGAQAEPEEKPAKPKKPGGQSHIRQARPGQMPKALPETGPMAEMLKKMFGPGDS
ncbi:aminoacyl-tRNA hydrolase [Xaviernesmea oryzae]|uniref:Peptidyl-tRNA hydrolase n=1 Tax=Xaviernesmea oryzae TaxID=464029 RepID=A0A1Q9AVB8_9HYPH|nr:aminoacyl-tRNA hydrolase [Xaviernesmea oryzae]OLP59400.1 aminoacyl-tRNA hydrolase [Xaviernesmea oryzae]SEL61613.1 peptidyl-tRNA hydrolase, PTH1 family [Xaviernesmea oryzae]